MEGYFLSGVARFGRIFGLGIALVAAFSLLMILSYSLPDPLIRKHMRTSIVQLELEENSCTSLVGLLSQRQDNFTDSMMLNLSMPPEGVSATARAFGNYMQMVKDPAEPTADMVPLESLKAAVTGKTGVRTTYARYWHGYQVVLRPLLLFFDYGAIRWLNSLIFTIFAMVVTVILRYRLGLGTALAFLSALAVVGVVAVPLSVNFSGVFYLAFTGMVMIALGMDRGGAHRLDLETFFFIGAVTAFVDVLTAPVLTLGMPLTVLLLGRLSSESASAIGRQCACFIRMSAVWSMGYAESWMAKWTISSLVLNKNVFLDAAQSVASRLNGTEAGLNFDRIETVRRNVAMLFPLFGCTQPQGIQWDVVAAACMLPAAVTIVVLMLLTRHIRRDGRQWRVIGLIPAGALPFAWYLIVNGHSRVHYFFTFRGLAVTVFVMLAALFHLFDPQYLCELNTKLKQQLRRSQ